MTNFFDSDVVRESMIEMYNLQQEIMQQILYVPYMNNQQKKEHLELMKTFLEKQKILFFRMSLTDDEKAKEVRDTVIKSAKMFGVIDSEDPQVFFSTLEKTINGLAEMIEAE